MNICRPLKLLTWVYAVLIAALAVANPVFAGANDIRFIAELSDNEQSSPTYSPAKGLAEVVLERETLKLTWTVTYKDLSSPPTEAGFYGPENVGATSGMLINIGEDGMNSPMKGSAIISDGELQYLINERIYVNIKSKKWPDGEIRGQLQRQPPH
ncbi:MAG: CHRD domain-containing protein [Rhodobacteraceae bacterium]|nr:CHRD domain-containing protein [Paracoccaceae bacterium]